MRTTRTLTAFFVSAFLCLYAASGYAYAQADPEHWKWCSLAPQGRDAALLPLSLMPASSRFTICGSTRISNVFPALPAIASPPNATTIPGEQTAPTSGPAGAEGPRFRDFGRALGYNFTRGLLSRKNLKPLLIGSAATVLFLPFDRKISDAVRGDLREFGDSGNVVGGPAGVATITGGLLLATQFTKSGRFHSYVFSETQGLALANAQVFALKYIVRRTRPDGSNQHSFPSAHAANIFVLAAVTSHYYGKKVGIPLYVVACLVAASRIEKGSHFPSDSIFGATLGYISAGTAIRGTQHFISALRKTP